MNIQSIFRDLVVSILGAACFRVLVALIPLFPASNIGEFTGVEILNNIILQMVVVTVLLFVMLVGARRLFEWNRERQKPTIGPAVAVVKNPPEKIVWGGFIDKYGVRWRSKYGHKRFGGTEAHIEGPFCPECAVELNTDEISRPIRGKAEAWLCPDCGNQYVRPASSYSNEEENVKKICESVVGRAQQNDIDVVNKRDDFHTEEWDNRSTRGYNSRRSY